MKKTTSCTRETPSPELLGPPSPWRLAWFRSPVDPETRFERAKSICVSDAFKYLLLSGVAWMREHGPVLGYWRDLRTNLSESQLMRLLPMGRRTFHEQMTARLFVEFVLEQRYDAGRCLKTENYRNVLLTPTSIAWASLTGIAIPRAVLDARPYRSVDETQKMFAAGTRIFLPAL